jgi:hypothetical protein
MWLSAIGIQLSADAKGFGRTPWRKALNLLILLITDRPKPKPIFT